MPFHVDLDVDVVNILKYKRHQLRQLPTSAQVLFTDAGLQLPNQSEPMVRFPALLRLKQVVGK